MKTITVPNDVVLMRPHTNEPLRHDNGQPELPVTFIRFLNNLLSNPMWVESYENLKSAKSIFAAIQNMKSTAGLGPIKLTLEDSDWEKLKSTAMYPKMLIVTPNGPVVTVGYGFHPQVSMQLLPMIEAIVNAESA